MAWPAGGAARDLSGQGEATDCYGVAPAGVKTIHAGCRRGSYESSLPPMLEVGAMGVAGGSEAP